MKSYLELTRNDLRLALRDKSVLFFSYLFPLIFFFAFAELFEAERGGSIAYVVSMVLLMGILGNGLFGAGLRTVHDREAHILRRFRVAPINSTPILVASLVTGWILYIPAVALVLGLASTIYGLEMPERPFSLFLMLSLGLIAFRALGLILAAVANSMQEVNILVQIFYTPLLFLSGALFPITVLPDWVQLISQYLPATYLVSGLQGIFLKGESILENSTSVLALMITVILGTFLSSKLFRWEKDEKVPASAKLWVLAVLAPFLVLGTLQLRSEDQIQRARALYREVQRSGVILIENARIFIGDGSVIERGAVLIRGGRIAAVRRGDWEEPVEAQRLNGAGKTLLPGLIDTYAYFAHPFLKPEQRASVSDIVHYLQDHLYCGVTYLRAVDLPEETISPLRRGIDQGSILAAEFRAARQDPESSPVGAGVVGSRIEDRLYDETVFRSDGPVEISAPGSLLLLEGRIPLLAPLLRDRPRQIFVVRPEEAPSRELSSLPEGLHLSPLLPYRGGGDSRRLPSTLTQQVLTPAELTNLEALWESAEPNELLLHNSAAWLHQLREHAPRALTMASFSGRFGRPHGPSIHEEIRRWVEAGVSPARALEAATGSAARALQVLDRMGLVREGAEANLLIVNGDPTQQMEDLERISTIIYRGELLDRSELLQRR